VPQPGHPASSEAPHAPAGPAGGQRGLVARLVAGRRRLGPPPEGRPGPWVILAAWGPCGFAPVAPGTFGTLGAIPLAWAAARLPLPGQVALAVALGALGTVAAGHAGRYWRVVDASPIVIDEVVGYLVTMLAVPFSWPAALVGFLLFRACDVLKPWPASLFDRMKSPLAVILDDVAAGVWAWALLRLVATVLARFRGCGDLAWYCGLGP